MSERPFEDRPTEGAFPEVADDDYPERERYPEVRGPMLPTEDGYQGAGAVGTTAEEERNGETLSQRLGQEVPESTEDPDDAGDVDAPREDWDDEIDGGVVGQLVSPDQGAGPDLEKDEIAFEESPVEGGSPEETALHLERE